ncbi:D-lactaldehyde dehydrogenase [Mycena latifolia]|nr:D-lactaldehyde dehydrogenase [Mycena latifolia]
MPTIASGKVLVSGANGFIGAWVVRALLEEGFSVRGAVRSASKGAHLRNIFASSGDKFEVVVVPDVTHQGAFDEAVKGVDAIEHTVSPTNFNGDVDGNTIISGVIQATTGMLQSALKHGTSVKRVVFTSSCAAVMQAGQESEPKTLTERDWNEKAEKDAIELGREAPGSTTYRAAKTLAERAGWEFVETHKPEIGWDLVVLNPPIVFGPHMHDAPTPDALRTSARHFHNILTQPQPPAALATVGSWVDVRDLARAHALALLKAEAGGERIIISAGTFTWQECLDAAQDSGKYQKGVPGAGKDAGAGRALRFDASKSARVLGMTAYRGLAEMVQDTAADWEARGW